MQWEHNYNEGRIALLSGDYILAEKQFHTALELLDKKSGHNALFIPVIEAQIGQALFQRKQYDKARVFCEKSESQFCESVFQDSYSRAINNYCLGHIYLNKGASATALEYFRLSEPFMRSSLHASHRYRQDIAEQLKLQPGFCVKERTAPPPAIQEQARTQTIEQIAFAEFQEKSAKEIEQCLSEAEIYSKQKTATSLWRAYGLLNRALLLQSRSSGFMSTYFAQIISMMVEISISICCDDMAIKLCRISETVNHALYGRSSLFAVRASCLTALAYRQRAQFGIAEATFKIASGTALAIEEAELIETFSFLKSYQRCLQEVDQAITDTMHNVEIIEHEESVRLFEAAQKQMLKTFPDNFESILPVLSSLRSAYHKSGLSEPFRQVEEQIKLIDELQAARKSRKQVTILQQYPLAVVSNAVDLVSQAS